MDYYGETDNFIHVKFGHMQKRYNFTDEFRKEYPEFSDEFIKYWLDMGDKFKTPMDIALYVKEHNIPVGFYFNFTDTPADNVDEVIDYLEWELNRENESDLRGVKALVNDIEVKLATAKGLINQPAEMLKYQIEDTQARYIVEEFFARNDEQAEKKLNDHIEGRRDVEYATAIDNGASEEEAAALAEEMDFYLNVSQVFDYETEVMGSADPRNA